MRTDTPFPVRRGGWAHTLLAPLALALVCAVAAPLGAAPAPSPNPPAHTGPDAELPAKVRRTVVVPDRFLRRWDPVTVFFPADRGPAAGGPEDHPERHFRLEPTHPGATRWLDARTLQFRPAEPWPALARFALDVDGRKATLSTLMEAPRATVPAEGAEGLEPVDAITLVFAERIDAGALARMVAIELRPLPGISDDERRVLTSADFEVKAMEHGDEPACVLALREPIPLGTRAVLRLRLALDDDPEVAFREIAFSTAAPFRAVALGCSPVRYPLAPGGSRFGREQAIRCDPGDPVVLVDLSGEPRSLDPVQGKNLVRLSPPVEDLEFSLSGRVVRVAGRFLRDREYVVSLGPSPSLVDVHGRPLEPPGATEVVLYFPDQPDYLRFGAGEAILERHGAKMVPLEGRGDERVDLRIHQVDPLERSFWPFPSHPVSVDESARPPGPGEEREGVTEPGRDPTPDDIAAYLPALGSPAASALVDLPLRKGGGAARFGLDLAPHLEKVAGERASGTYLVGVRRTDGSAERSWMRVQVTDLALTTVEEPRRVRFQVTSLRSGAPVEGARVRVEGSRWEGKWIWFTLVDGATGPDGAFLGDVAGGRARDNRGGAKLRRIVVEKGDDALVLDPARPPERYADGHWHADGGTWLSWTQEPLDERVAGPEVLAHVFTERPVYRPEDPVHVRGWARVRERGELRPLAGKGTVVVSGPGETEWRYPLTLTSSGGFYQRFAEARLPTGEYRAAFLDQAGAERGSASFRMEAYRIPRFEVRLNAPDQVPSDREFRVGLAAVYYAGGKVGGQPVAWRVSQYPYAWSPKPREGFVYSSDGRFSATSRFEASPRLEREDATDPDGAAALVLDPAIEPTAAPRTYVIEATVTGPDDQTVTATRRVHALPPFVLGLKAPRFLEKAEAIEPEVLAVGPDGEPIAGQAIQVRLLHRQWHSHLKASDFSDGVARYLTDVVDVPVGTQQATSAAEPVRLRFPIAAAGVYVVEVESRDRLGRTQTVAVDLYAGGEGPVAWAKPAGAVFQATPEKKAYDPGETAAVVLESPFQEARALAVIEAPEGNAYAWLDVRGGKAVHRLAAAATWTPRVPVHYVLLRGRIQGTAGTAASGTDLGRPATMAATTWLTVNPAGNQVEVALEHAERALPGRTIPITIRLADPDGRPLAGEVALWLVDQAVLALGQEQRLDPLPDFLKAAVSRLTLRDTRNLALGELPLALLPGGDEGEGEPKDLLDRTTVRRNFQPVPFYDPAVQVGPEGVAVVQVKLSDDLTNFKVRAKAASADGKRFGHAASQVAVRLPVIVQPALPRFVRPGDSFVASAIGRIIEGEGGPGAAQIRVRGATLRGSERAEIAWTPERPERLEFPLEVPTPPYTDEGKLAYEDIAVQVGVERMADGAADAFEVKLPVRDDRSPVTRRVLAELAPAAAGAGADLAPGTALDLPGIDEPARPGSVKRSVLVADEPALVRMLAALDFLLEYPHGCTEQRLSRARAQLALHRMRGVLASEGDDEALAAGVRATEAWVRSVLDRDLAAYWPGGRGYVSLTAWVVQFLVEARAAGFPIDESLLATLLRSLEAALRSDYARFVDGESWAERAWALTALAQAGKLEPAYAAELGRKPQFLDLESSALVADVLERAGGKPAEAQVETLIKKIWEGVVFRLHQGRETYGGLQDPGRGAHNELILPGETRTLARVTRTLARLQRGAPRLPVLVAGLTTLGRDDGWGSTNANAEALLALAEVLETPADRPERTVRVRFGDREHALVVGRDVHVAHAAAAGDGKGQAVLDPSSAGPVVVLAETTYTPLAPGSEAAPAAAGFVVTRAAEVHRKPAASLPAPAGATAPTDVPGERTEIAPATVLALAIGDVVEDHVQVVNPEERHFVAVVVPLAAGVEPLNPHLQTAPPEAAPRHPLTLAATYAAYLDDQVAFYYDTLPAGTYDFHFRVRATIEGRFIQPAAYAEMMYDQSVRGGSAGAWVKVRREER